MKWTFAIKEDLYAVGILEADITDREICRNTVFDWKVGQPEKHKKTGKF